MRYSVRQRGTPASAPRTRTRYRTTAVIEERFCAGLGSESRRKADPSNFQHEFANFDPRPPAQDGAFDSKNTCP